jgi:hypothetical protein
MGLVVRVVLLRDLNGRGLELRGCGGGGVAGGSFQDGAAAGYGHDEWAVVGDVADDLTTCRRAPALSFMAERSWLNRPTTLAAPPSRRRLPACQPWLRQAAAIRTWPRANVARPSGASTRRPYSRAINAVMSSFAQPSFLTETARTRAAIAFARKPVSTGTHLDRGYPGLIRKTSIAL